MYKASFKPNLTNVCKTISRVVGLLSLQVQEDLFPLLSNMTVQFSVSPEKVKLEVEFYLKNKQLWVQILFTCWQKTIAQLRLIL